MRLLELFFGSGGKDAPDSDPKSKRVRRRFSGRKKAEERPERSSSGSISSLGSYENEFDLEQRDEEIVNSLGNKVPLKLIQFFGDARLLPKKARKIYGDVDMTVEQLRAQRRAELLEREIRKLKYLKDVEEVLKRKPTPQQLSLPIKDQAISQKALRLLGDDYLNDQALRVLTPEMRENVGRKTIQLFGETCMLTPKQQQLLGELDFSPHQSHKDHSRCIQITGV